MILMTSQMIVMTWNNILMTKKMILTMEKMINYSIGSTADGKNNIDNREDADLGAVVCF